MRYRFSDILQASRLRRKAPAALALALLTLLALEIVLSFAGYALYYPYVPPVDSVEQVDWISCDELGCLYVQAEVQTACRQGHFREYRTCVINAQGYGDTEDFVYREDLPDYTRILMLGDSFTQGFSADYGSSFVELLEANLPEAMVWNGGLTGTGTAQALVTLEAFAPVMQPNLVVLGFFMNDFTDNLVPLNGWMQLENADGRTQWVRRYQVDRWGNIIEAPDEVIYAYAAQGLGVPPNAIEPLVGATRLGSLVLRFLDRVGSSHIRHTLDYQAQVSRDYLAQLRDSVQAHDSQLLVLLIPRREDIASPGDRYLKAAELFQELGLAYMDIRPFLDPAQDYMPFPNEHWNNSGHQKVGALLSECVAMFFSGRQLADCEHVTMP